MIKRTPLTNDELKGRMTYHLKYMKKKSNTAITFDVPLKDMISTNSVGPIQYDALFETYVKMELQAHGNDVKDWPDDWTAKTINELSAFLLS